MAGIRHTTVASGPNDPTKQVSSSAWNETHTLDTSLNFPPQASDPASPSNGDVWSTTSGDLKTRTGGVSRRVLTTTSTQPFTTLEGHGITDAAGTFSTRADFVSWATGKTPAIGTVKFAVGYAYRYIGTGTVISDLPGWVPNGAVYTPGHWGAVGDGITDDGLKLNQALAAYKVAVESVSNFNGSLDFDGLGLTYRSTISINATGITSWGWHIKNLTILSEATEKIAFDIIGSRGGHFTDVLVYGNETNRPKYGIVAARAASGGQEAFADQTVMGQVRTRGYFSVSAYYAYGQESLYSHGCEFWNSDETAHCGIVSGTDIYPITSDYLAPITGSTSHINCLQDRVEFRYLPMKQQAVSAITRGTSTVLTIASAVFSVGDNVVLANTGAIAGIESTKGTVTAVSGLTITLDLDSTGWTSYGGSGVTAIIGQKKATLLLANIKGHSFVSPYLVNYGTHPVEIQFPSGVASSDIRIQNACIEAYGIQKYCYFNTQGATSGRQIIGFEFTTYQGRALDAYFTSDVTYGSGGVIGLYEAKISVLTTIVPNKPLFDDERKYALYDVDLNVIKATMVDGNSFAAFKGTLSSFDDGKVTNYKVRISGNVDISPTSGSIIQTNYKDVSDVLKGFSYYDTDTRAFLWSPLGTNANVVLLDTAYYPATNGAVTIGLSNRAFGNGYFDKVQNVLAVDSIGFKSGVGSGGTVTQLTSKSTPVTLNKKSGQIVMNNASLATGARVAFRLNNSTITPNSVVVPCIVGPSTQYSITLNTIADAGGYVEIGVTNLGVTASDAIKINFIVMESPAD